MLRPTCCSRSTVPPDKLNIVLALKLKNFEESRAENPHTESPQTRPQQQTSPLDGSAPQALMAVLKGLQPSGYLISTKVSERFSQSTYTQEHVICGPNLAVI